MLKGYRMDRDNNKQHILKTMLKDVNEKGYNLQGSTIDSSKLIFEERVKMNCFYCGKYNVSWKCPPKMPDIDYRKMLDEYGSAAFIYVKQPLEGKDYNLVRNDSSLQLHRGLLACERWLWEKDNSMAISFIGGSCKLCKNGCAPDRCANPYLSRSPIEALGINVVKSAELFGIQINFPPKEFMMRVGLLLW